MSRLALIHNLTESDLLFANKWLGGLPCPSMAVVDTDIGLSGFGEITLVMDPGEHNFRRFPAYTADVYTQRIPSAQFQADEGKLTAFYDSIEASLPEGVLSGAKRDLHYRLTEEYQNGLDDVSGSVRFNACARLAFMQLKGIDVDIPYKQVEPPYAFLRDEKVVESLNALRPIIWGSEQATKAAKIVSDYNVERLERSNVSELLRRNLEKVFYVQPDGSLKTDSLKPLVFEDMNTFLSKRDKGVHVDDYTLMRRIDETFDEHALASEMKAWIDQNLKDTFHSPYFHERVRHGERVKHTDFTLKEVTRYLKKQANNTDSNGFSGAGSVRALLSTPMKSMKAIEAHRHMLSTKEDFAIVKDTMNNRYADFPEKLAPYYRFDSSSYLYRNDCYKMIQGMARSGSTRILDEGYELADIPEEVIADIQTFFREVNSAKTEYFEVNVKDEITFDQFAYAIVPDDLGQEAKTLLESKGLTLVAYTAEQGRERALKMAVADCHFGKDIERKSVHAEPEMSL